MPTLLLAFLLAAQPPAAGPPPTTPTEVTEPAPTADAPAETPEAPLTEAERELLKGAVPLNEAGTVLLDRARKRVAVKAEVCLTNGSLEMLLCLPQTKEHESILKFEGDARTLHAALVAAGIEPGTPVSFDPEFVPPRGTKLDLTLHWTDADGAARTASAHDWIRTSTDKWYEAPQPALPAGLSLPEDLELRYAKESRELLWYGQMSEADRDRALALSPDETFRTNVRTFFEQSQPRAMSADFVFAGSFFYDKPVTYNSEGEVTETVRTYAAEGGEVVCVANFPAALIDIAERSSAEGQGVLYEAATERIPPVGTRVFLTFAAKAAPAGAAAEPGDAAAGDGAAGQGDGAGADDSAGPAGGAKAGG